MTPKAAEIQDQGDSKEGKLSESVAYKSGGIYLGRWRAVARLEWQWRPPNWNENA